MSRRKTTQMGDNAFRWKCKPLYDGGCTSYTVEDLKLLKEMKEKKLKQRKKGERNNARKYRFKK